MENDELDWLEDILGLNVDDDRRTAVLAAYRDILGELEKLRTLDLTDVHPAVVFSPTASPVEYEELRPIPRGPIRGGTR